MNKVEITKIELTTKQKSTASSNRKNTIGEITEFGQCDSLWRDAKFENFSNLLKTTTDVCTSMPIMQDKIAKMKHDLRFFDVANWSLKNLLPNKAKIIFDFIVMYFFSKLAMAEKSI